MLFTDNKGRKIELEVCEVNYTIDALHDGEKLGGFNFNYCEDPHNEYLLVTNMHLENIDGFLRAGIGSKIIEVAKSEFGMPILFRDNDGVQRDDGSHLTGDGAAFASAMQKKRRKE